MMQRSRNVSKRKLQSDSQRESPQKLEEQFQEAAQFEKVIRESLQRLEYGQ
ncbi:MAG: hypothetical protein RBJ76_00410 (plasmid) [Stenomitos frigidus ULC029]